ncbi:MAG TPA: helix-turn-helix transcriptional regulator [Terriglobia bacterium]|nr:helix-turn-helix transcriptional regulator [Terriglobia bacterium]
MKKRGKAAYMISNVAQNYNIHPQTLRLYERQGLLKPSRSEGNTRLFTDEDLERLELILTLTRDLGVNLAGVEVVLNMRDKMMEMQKEVGRFLEMIRKEFSQVTSHYQEKVETALVPAPPPKITRFKRPSSQ